MTIECIENVSNYFYYFWKFRSFSSLNVFVCLNKKFLHLLLFFRFISKHAAITNKNGNGNGNGNATNTSNSVEEKNIIHSNSSFSSSSLISMKAKNQKFLSENTNNTFLSTYNNKNENFKNKDEKDRGSNAGIKRQGQFNSLGDHIKNKVISVCFYFLFLLFPYV